MSRWVAHATGRHLGQLGDLGVAGRRKILKSSDVEVSVRRDSDGDTAYSLTHPENDEAILYTVVRKNADRMGAGLETTEDMTGRPAKKGTGVGTVLYLRALKLAQEHGKGWESATGDDEDDDCEDWEDDCGDPDEGLSSQAEAIYQRLADAGVPFKEHGSRGFAISATELAKVDLKAIERKLAKAARG